jgi:hypothetical protein
VSLPSPAHNTKEASAALYSPFYQLSAFFDTPKMGARRIIPTSAA